MQFKYYFLAVVLSAASFISCSSDDDSILVIPTTVTESFHHKFPTARPLEWERKGIYYVAEFGADNHSSEAWFSPDGQWHLTTSEIDFTQLPLSVQESFKQTKYGTSEIDEIEKVEKFNCATRYIIEVEKGEQDFYLYYLGGGELIKVISEDEYLVPAQLPESVSNYISEHYPQVQVLEVENDGGTDIEIEIYHEAHCKEVYFSSSDCQWIYTTWEVERHELPAAVETTLAKLISTHHYVIDDIHFVETKNTNYYSIEVEKGNQESTIKIDTNGYNFK